MANRNYNSPSVSPEWASSHATAMVVAVSIHAIADAKRSAQDIWAAPTPAEWQHVEMAIEEKIKHGDYPHDEDGYSWGDEIIGASLTVNS